MKNDIKYYYCFRPNLDTHVQFYKGWVNEARKRDIPMRLITFLPVHYYIKNYKKVLDLKSDSRAVVIPIIPKLNYLFMFIYFSIQICTSKKVIVHLKKVNPNPVFFGLKRLSNKIKIIVDLEGDPKLEKEYLLEHPYKDGFYKDIFDDFQNNINNQKKIVTKADLVLCANETFRNLMISRYSDCQDKFKILPTGVDINKFYFDEDERNEIRSRMKLHNRTVFIFVGNIFYSWQNISKTLKIFLKYKDLNEKAYFILLTRKKDFKLANDFINKIGIDTDSIKVDCVPNKEVRKYLNAADIGVVIRDNHKMNKVASPGKVGEYVACGLPIIMTDAASIYSKNLQKSGQATLIDSQKNVDSIVKTIVPFINKLNKMPINNRENFTKDNVHYFSNSGYGEKYKKILEDIAKI